MPIINQNTTSNKSFIRKVTQNCLFTLAENEGALMSKAKLRQTC